LAPAIRDKQRCLFLILDCMRLDQWLVIEPMLKDLFTIKQDYYYSILPTATPYARNAIFSGLFPAQIMRNYPQYWRRAIPPTRPAATGTSSSCSSSCCSG